MPLKLLIVTSPGSRRKFIQATMVIAAGHVWLLRFCDPLACCLLTTYHWWLLGTFLTSLQDLRYCTPTANNYFGDHNLGIQLGKSPPQSSQYQTNCTSMLWNVTCSFCFREGNSFADYWKANLSNNAVITSVSNNISALPYHCITRQIYYTGFQYFFMVTIQFLHSKGKKPKSIVT